MKKIISKWMVCSLSFLCILSIAVSFSQLNVQAAAKKPKKMTIITTGKTIGIKGKTKITVKSVSPSNASKKVTYKSSNKKIATVNKSGVVTGKKKGTVKITVTSKANKKLKRTVKITVKNIKPTQTSASVAVPVVPSTKVTFRSEKDVIVSYATEFSNPAVADDNSTVSYTSSKPTVATVDSKGTVKILNYGEATITAQTSFSSSSYKVICNDLTQKYKAMSYEAWNQTGLSYSEMKSHIDQGALVLDLRRSSDDAWGYDYGHVIHSIHIPCFPVQEATETAILHQAMNEGLIPKDKEIILICKSGLFGVKNAKSYLVNNGYKESNITFLIGGGMGIIGDHLGDTNYIETTHAATNE